MPTEPFGQRRAPPHPPQFDVRADINPHRHRRGTKTQHRAPSHPHDSTAHSQAEWRFFLLYAATVPGIQSNVELTTRVGHWVKRKHVSEFSHVGLLIWLRANHLGIQCTCYPPSSTLSPPSYAHYLATDNARSQAPTTQVRSRCTALDAGVDLALCLTCSATDPAGMPALAIRLETYAHGLADILHSKFPTRNWWHLGCMWPTPQSRGLHLKSPLDLEKVAQRERGHAVETCMILQFNSLVRLRSLHWKHSLINLCQTPVMGLNYCCVPRCCDAPLRHAVLA